MNIINFIVRQYNKFIAIPFFRRKLKNITILDSMTSIRYIIENRCSVSRFGDGEFDVIMGGSEGYTRPNTRLAASLKHVLMSSDAPNHMVGIPLPMKEIDGLRPLSRDFWGFFVKNNINEILPLLSNNRTYIDTQLSRFYIAYTDKSNCAKHVELLKKLWDGRDIVIVEGTQSRTGVGNDLYDNAKSLKRILGPAKDAFDVYDKMLNAITCHVSKNQLILMSYGPCATILAYDLAKLGYQAIDLGHLDIEYEWFRTGATTATAVKGKFTNEAEAEGGHVVEDCHDEKYLNQIICDITK